MESVTRAETINQIAASGVKSDQELLHIFDLVQKKKKRNRAHMKRKRAYEKMKSNRRAYVERKSNKQHDVDEKDEVPKVGIADISDEDLLAILKYKKGRIAYNMARRQKRAMTSTTTRRLRNMSLADAPAPAENACASARGLSTVRTVLRWMQRRFGVRGGGGDDAAASDATNNHDDDIGNDATPTTAGTDTATAAPGNAAALDGTAAVTGRRKAATGRRKEVKKKAVKSKRKMVTRKTVERTCEWCPVTHEYLFPVIINRAKTATTAWQKTISEAKCLANNYDSLRDFRINNFALAKDNIGKRKAKELKRCVVVPRLNSARIVEPSNGGAPVGFIMAVANIGTTPELEPLKKCLLSFPETEEVALHNLVIPFLLLAQKHGIEDTVRCGIRVNLGWSELPTYRHRHFKGAPTDINSGCFVPRINAAHSSDHCGHFLDNLLPMLSATMKLIQFVFKNQYPDKADPISVLQSNTGCLCFPHNPFLTTGEDGRPRLLPRNEDHILACECISRLSISFVAGNSATDKILKAISQLYPTTDISKIRPVINKNGHSILHLDERDVGAGGKLKQEEKYISAGIAPVQCSDRVLQFVFIFSFKMTDEDALAAVGLNPNEDSFTLEAPAFDSREQSIRCVVYGMDFSCTYHGNIQESRNQVLPEDAWVLRVTSYVTVHAATWNAELKKRSTDEAKQILLNWSGLEAKGL